MKVGSLFAGIGGFDLGLERAGMTVKWQVEINPYCQQVLAQHWPEVQRYGDITQVDWAGVEPVDLLCGGFPCQDLSVAGRGAGITGSRSGLWSEYVRAIRSLRPRYVLVENVPGLLANAAMGRVLKDLAESGYDAEWQVLSAADFGAPHVRKRVWIIATLADSTIGRLQRGIFSIGLHGTASGERTGESPRSHPGSATLADSAGERFSDGGRTSMEEHGAAITQSQRCGGASGGVCDVADSERLRSQRERNEWSAEGSLRLCHGTWADQAQAVSCAATRWWAVEPNVGRVAHGVPKRVDRLKGLGNAVVPQIVEWLGRSIIDRDIIHQREGCQ